MNTQQAQSRDIAVDILRGIAIFTMIAANLAGVILKEPHPMWLRTYGSVAAPCFILLSGMMVGFSACKKSYSFSHYLVRGLIIIFIGALIDIVSYRAFPLCTFDVLYLIGFSMILAHFVVTLKTKYKILLTLSIFLVTPFLQKIFPYEAAIPDITSFEVYKSLELGSILKNWLIDGWFPVFPWLGYSFSGLILADIRWKKETIYKFANSKFFTSSIFLLIFGVIIWVLNPGPLYCREGFSELFYPVTYGYILTSIGVILTLFSIIDFKPDLLFYKPFCIFGEVSLLMYILHLGLINIIPQKFIRCDFNTYAVFYVIISALCLTIAYSMKFIRKKWPKRNFVIKMFTG